MKTFIPFILGILITISIAAGVQDSFMTIKPAKPIHTVSYCGPEPHSFTVKYSAQGYVVTMAAATGYYDTYIVMCKY